MDIDLARTFLEIARCGSLVAAAEKLHVTQTAITARVQKLESQLDARLFIRNRAGARLTADGEAFVVYANQLVALPICRCRKGSTTCCTSAAKSACATR